MITDIGEKKSCGKMLSKCHAVRNIPQMEYPEIEPGLLEWETASATAQPLVRGLRIEDRGFSANRILEYGIFVAKVIIKQLQNWEAASTVSRLRTGVLISP